MRCTTSPARAAITSRCLRVEAIDWAALKRPAARLEPVRIGGTVLEVARLKKHYRVAASALFGKRESRAVKAVEDISFAAREAEVLAIVGKLGCGKSTLAKVLLGLETASEGLVVFDHEAIQNQPVETARSSHRLEPDDLPGSLRPLNPRFGWVRHAGALEKFRVGANNAERRDIMLRLLDLVKLPRAFAGRTPRQLSGGQKQRIGVARAFAGRPRVIIADEPMSALDVSVQAAISELLMSLRREVADDDGVHQPRSVGRALSRRPGPRDVSRPYRRNGLNRADLLAAVPPLYGSAVVRDSYRRRAR